MEIRCGKLAVLRVPHCLSAAASHQLPTLLPDNKHSHHGSGNICRSLGHQGRRRGRKGQGEARPRRACESARLSTERIRSEARRKVLESNLDREDRNPWQPSSSQAQVRECEGQRTDQAKTSRVLLMNSSASETLVLTPRVRSWAVSRKSSAALSMLSWATQMSASTRLKSTSSICSTMLLCAWMSCCGAGIFAGKGFSDNCETAFGYVVCTSIVDVAVLKTSEFAFLISEYAGDDEDEVVKYTAKMEKIYDAARRMKLNQGRNERPEIVDHEPTRMLD